MRGTSRLWLAAGLWLAATACLPSCSDETTRQRAPEPQTRETAETPSAADTPAPATKPTTRPGVLAEFAFNPDIGFIRVPVEPDGREYPFVLDTGSTHCAFDESLRDLLGEPVDEYEMATHAGSIPIEAYRPPPAVLGRIDLDELEFVVCLDLEIFRHIGGTDIRGIIGMDALRDRVVQIDFDAGRVTIRKPDERPRPEWGEAVPLRVVKGYPIVEAGIASGRGQFLIDTGDTGGVTLNGEGFELVRKATGAAVTTDLYATAAGTVRRRLLRLRRFRLGEFEYPPLVVGESDFSSIGAKVLSRTNVVFDFAGGAMHLRKRDRFDRPGEADMSGLHLLRIDGETVVHSVDRDSPAERAGIEAQDVILTVDGKSPDTWTMQSLRGYLRREHGRVVRMTLRRGEEELKAAFRLRRRL